MDLKIDFDFVISNSEIHSISWEFPSCYISYVDISDWNRTTFPLRDHFTMPFMSFTYAAHIHICGKVCMCVFGLAIPCAPSECLQKKKEK